MSEENEDTAQNLGATPVESITTRNPLVEDEGSEHSASDGENDDETVNVNKGKNRETTPARSEATEPPNSGFGEDDGQEPDVEINDDEARDIQAAIQASKETYLAQSARTNKLNPNSSPSKLPRLALNETIRRTYKDPQTPQKRKGQRQPDGRDATSPSPDQQSVTSSDVVQAELSGGSDTDGVHGTVTAANPQRANGRGNPR
ncbi:hypothetical protein AAF712_010449 [Marasmius tenuissimus]|uniref:Uncharacterized protein n=1 Tax=Marasmius tenuissimus TaxID=585030 RepID=A0ABR2ZLY2_9AGAR